MDTCTFPGCGKPAFVKRTSLGALCNGHYAQFKRNKPLTSLRGYERQESDGEHATCPYPECGRPSWHKYGYCQSHQRQLWAAKGDEDQLQPIRESSSMNGQSCRFPDCDQPAKSRGFCSKHYRSDWGECRIENCGKRIHNKKTGLCAKHYKEKEKIEVVNDPV